MGKVLIPQPVDEAGVDYLKQQGHDVMIGTELTEEALSIAIEDCDAVLLRTAKLPESVIRSGRKLKIIARHGVGYDNIDVKAATELGVIVTNTPEALADSVAEYTLAALLMCAKNIRSCSREMAAGNDTYKNTHKGIDLMTRTLGIAGFGRIGHAVAKKAWYGLGMKVIAYHPRLKPEEYPEYVTPVTFDQLLEESDILSLHVPLNQETTGLMGRRQLEQMKPDAYLMNMARGEVIKEEDLLAVLKEGRLRSVFLDTLCEEPVKPEHPLLHIDRVIVTPHMASNTEECMARMAVHAASEIGRVLAGEEPKWQVNRGVR